MQSSYPLTKEFCQDVEIVEFLINYGLIEELEEILKEVVFLNSENKPVSNLEKKYQRWLSKLTTFTEMQVATASLRSPDGYNLADLMSKIQQDKPKSFQKFGGHPQAAGFSAEVNKLSSIEKEFDQKLSTKPRISQKIDFLPKDFPKLPKSWSNYAFDPSVIWLNYQEIDNQLLSQLWSLDPFGQDLPFPRIGFFLKDFERKFLGAEQSHLKIILPNNLEILYFSFPNTLKTKLSNLDPENQNQNKSKYQTWIIAKPSQNFWQNKLKNQLVVEEFLMEESS